MTRTWLITGGTGMLGTELFNMLTARGEEVVALGSSACDVRDPESIADALAHYRPDILVNCAAHTAVDAAETEESAAFALNAIGPRNLARAAYASGVEFVHVSTDYVFDGQATEPYEVDALVNPRSAYGRTKAAGEWAVRLEHPDARIVRTAWLYGAHGGNFVATMLNLSAKMPTLDVVNDQVGQPTWTGDLAEMMVALVDEETPGGFYHGTSAGRGTWFDLAQEAYRIAGLDPERIKPTTSDKFQRPAPRPAFSVLAPAPVGPRIGEWRERLAASGVVEGVMSKLADAPSQI